MLIKSCLTHCPLGDVDVWISNTTLRLISWVFKSTLPWYECQKTLDDGKLKLVLVMVWCNQATSHYLNQCWPRSQMPYGITRPQWVNFILYNLHWITPYKCPHFIVLRPGDTYIHMCSWTASSLVEEIMVWPSAEPPGGVLGWVSDRDAQHRPLTQNATKGKKGGRNYTFCQILTKNRVEIWHFHYFCWNIGVKTIQKFERPEKGGSKWRSICSNLHRVSTLPGAEPMLNYCQLGR